MKSVLEWFCFNFPTQILQSFKDYFSYYNWISVVSSQMYAKMPKFVEQFPGCQCPRTPALLAAEVNTHQESKYI